MLSQNFIHVIGGMLDSPKICLESSKLKYRLLNQVPFPIMYVGFSFLVHSVFF